MPRDSLRAVIGQRVPLASCSVGKPLSTQPVTGGWAAEAELVRYGCTTIRVRMFPVTASSEER
jgi:hypothetical protein